MRALASKDYEQTEGRRSGGAKDHEQTECRRGGESKKKQKSLRMFTTRSWSSEACCAGSCVRRSIAHVQGFILFEVRAMNFQYPYKVVQVLLLLSWML